MRCIAEVSFQRVMFGIVVACFLQVVQASGQNQAPQIQPLPDRTIDEETQLSFSVVATDADNPQQRLTFSLGSGASSGASLDATNGLFTWFPSERVGPGTNLFSVIVTDDGQPSLSATQQFTVIVLEANRAPIVQTIPDRTVNEGEFLVASALADDPDLPVQSLTYSLGTGTPAGMTISPVGLITWTPGDTQGPSTNLISVVVTDDGSPSLSTTQQFTVVVVEVNFPPDLPAIDNRSLNETEVLTFTVPATDPDLPAQTLTYSLGAGAPEGVAIDPASGVFTWTPTESQGPGSYQIGVIVTDNGTPPLSDAKSFVVTVSEVNRPPEIAPIVDQVINVGGFLVFSLSATDEDIPHQTLIYSLGEGAPAGAALSDGGLFTWTPGQQQVNTTNLLAVIVSDGSLSVTQRFTVTVVEANLSPTLAPLDDRIVNEGELIQFLAAGADLNVPAQTLTYSLGAGAPEGVAIDPTSGAFTWTPTESQGPGSYLIGVIATDNGTPPLSAARSFVVTVNEVNRPPEIGAIADQMINVGGFLVFSVLATDEDIPHQTLSYSLGAGAPAGASLSDGGLFTWTPSAAQVFTTNALAVIVSDGSLSVTQRFTVTVVEANRSPTLETINDLTVNEGELLQFAAVGADLNVPAQTLTYSLGAGAPEGVAIDPASGVFTWTPTESQGPGSYLIGVIVTDNGTPPLSAARSFVVTVNEVNRPPEIGAIADQMINVGGFLVFSVPATDEDIPHQTLSYSLGTGAPAGAALSSGGLFTWTPSQQQARTTNQINFIVTDGSLSTTQSVSVVVLEVNLAPTLAAITNRTVREGELLTFTVGAADANLPVQTLTYSLGGGAPEGALIDPVSGVFTWTPGELRGGSTNQIGVFVTDNGLPPLSAAQSFIVIVEEANSPPSIAPIPEQSISPGTPLALTISASDSDVPVQSLTFSLGAGAPEGAALSAGGLFTWTPAASQSLTTNQLSAMVSDGSLSVTQMFTVVVLGNTIAPPQLVNPSFTANTFRASVNSLSGRKYFFERNESVTPNTWLVVGEFPGTGGTIVLTDPTATNVNSIYRARVE